MNTTERVSRLRQLSSPGLEELFKKLVQKVKKAMPDLDHVPNARLFVLAGDASGETVFAAGRNTESLIPILTSSSFTAWSGEL